MHIFLLRPGGLSLLVVLCSLFLSVSVSSEKSNSATISSLLISIPFTGATEECPPEICPGNSTYVTDYACLYVEGSPESGTIDRFGIFPVSLGESNRTDLIQIPFTFQDPNPQPNDYVVTGFSISLQGLMLSSRPKNALLYFEMANEVQFGTYILLGGGVVELATDMTELCPNCASLYPFELLKAAKSATLYNTGGRNNFLILLQEIDVPVRSVYVVRSEVTWNGTVANWSSTDPPPAGDNDDQMKRSFHERGILADQSLYCIAQITIQLDLERFPHSQTTSTLIIILATFLGVTTLVLMGIFLAWYFHQRRARQQLAKPVSIQSGDVDALPLLAAVNRMDIVNFKDIEIYQKIGRGSFGDVFRASWAGTIVALKVLPSAMHFSPEILHEFKREITLMTTLRHPNIVQFLAANTMPPDVFVILEYMSRGSLANILHDKMIRMPPALRCKLLLDAARGMQYLHSSVPPIIHRDLKSANLLVDDTWRLKVADFGLARIFSKQGESMSLVGSASWTAPEILNHQHATEKVDVYSFGIVIWECLTREAPHADLSAFQILIQVSQHGARPPVPAKGPPRLIELMKLCWAENPLDRPTFKHILKTLASLVNSFPDAAPELRPEYTTRFEQISPSRPSDGARGHLSTSPSLFQQFSAIGTSESSSLLGNPSRVLSTGSIPVSTDSPLSSRRPDDRW